MVLRLSGLQLILTCRPDKALAPPSGNLRQRNFHFIFPFSSSIASFLNGRGLIPSSFLSLCCDIDNKFYLDHLKSVNLHPKT
ncbi:hypothetical protein DQT76_24055 [Salmonella enterica subsp. diarizonae]|nr:hypothetical protein [Salmonella enterica subsp. diarizonae]EAN8504772.1 hypothetical protein [Salmonella enterica]